MQLDQAIIEFFNGYFSTHDRSKKTEVAYKSDLEQLAAYAPKACSLSSLDAALIESWGCGFADQVLCSCFNATQNGCAQSVLLIIHGYK
jgi:hypothetical protein